MSHDELLRQMLDRRLTAILRTPTSDGLVELAKSIREAGISMFEVTLTIPDGFSVIKNIKAALGKDVIVGAGTVLDGPTARMAIAAGAEFLVSPTFHVDVVQTARRFGKISIPGAFTPTEILTAWDAGADIVKVFPAEVLGATFFRSVLRPLPQVRLMPTGNISLAAAAEFLQAGACGVGIGGELSNSNQIQQAHDLARKYVEVVQANPPCR
jgi:2-dehydro-3-deoxyphosphogluconate aldolase / (4S)-4-hydroxy-2-oxoglutarate aldolase